MRLRIAAAGVVLLGLMFFPLDASAQVTNVTDQVSPPIPGADHNYLGALNETVNPANGSVNLGIQLPLPPGRKVKLPFSIGYNGGNGPCLQPTSGGLTGCSGSAPFSFAGWSYGVPQLSRTTATYNPGKMFADRSTICSLTTGYNFSDPSGAVHSLQLDNIYDYWGTLNQVESDACFNARYTNYLTGGDSVYSAALVGASSETYSNTNPSVIEGTPTVVSADGTAYAFGGGWNCYGAQNSTTYGVPTSITDRNGNTIRASVSFGCSSLTETDTLGRTSISATWPAFGQNNQPETATVAVAGLAQPYTVNWTVVSYSGYTYSSNLVLGASDCASAAGRGIAASGNEVTSITQPNGQQYEFSYDPAYGTLSTITYPSGGYVSYTWGLNAKGAVVNYVDENQRQCSSVYDSLAVTKRIVSFDGVSQTLEQDFSYSTAWDTTYPNVWDSKTTTVTTKDLVRGTSYSTKYNYRYVYVYPAEYTTAQGNYIPIESSIQYYDTNGTLLKTLTKNWSSQFLLACEVEQLGTNGPMSSVFYSYGPGGQVTDKKEYNYGLTTLATACSSGGAAPAGASRETVTTYQPFPTPAHFAGPVILDRPCKVVVKDGGSNVVAETDTYYDGGTVLCGGSPTAGNGTNLVKKCLQSAPACSAGNPTTTYTYDGDGQVLTIVDPNGNASGGTPSQHTTTYSYTDNYSSCGGNAPPTSPSDAYLTQVTYPPTSGVNHIESFCYDYATGLLFTSTDENSQVATYKYVDSFNRLTETDSPGGGQTLITYNDAPPTPSVTTSKKLNTSGQLVTSTSTMDGMGHLTQAQLTSDPQGTDTTLTAYDGMARTYKSYNPYRRTSDPTYGYTTYVYDVLGRTTSVTKPDGSVVQTQYCNAPPSTAVTSSILVTDEAGHWRRSETDGLGRLVEVDEPNSTSATVNVCPGTGEPIWVTTYSYDTLNNLVGVSQGSSRPRSFVYNSLKQLLQSTNPESGTICYGKLSGTNCQQNGYDANGNVVYKTDARLITTTTAFDALNRATGVTYSNGDPSLAFTYDQSACLGQPACYNIGHRTTMTDAGGTENIAYDKMGRELAEQRTTNSITKSTTYTYDLAGDLTNLTYPSGRMITYSYDLAGRASEAQDVANSINYALGSCLTGSSSTGVCYSAFGSVDQMQNGTNLISTFLYNTRLQPCWLYATTGSALATNTACTATDSTPGNILDMKYSFNLGAGDNGNVIGITNNRTTGRTQSFAYDQVNRILTAQTSSTTTNCWGESYTYDQWANMYAITGLSGYGAGCSQDNLSVSATVNNQLSTTGYSYDASGNMLTDGAYTYGYNAESEIKSAAGVNYTYDGDGNRLQKSNGKIYWHGAGTEILDESDASGNFINEYVYFGGRRIAVRNVSSGVIDYYAEDMLGSSRAMVQAGQTSLCYDADFLPFGKEVQVIDTCNQNYKFEGKERDTETSNDDFGARYFSYRIGRWLSADWSSVPAPVPYANLSNPQTLNLYTMVSDNPESFADLDGHSSGVACLASCNSVEPGSSGRCTLDNIPIACSMVVGALTSESAMTKEEANGQQDPGQSTADALINRVRNFDSDVAAATDADLARGSSSDKAIDDLLKNPALDPGQKEAQVGLHEQDIQKKDLEKAIDAYVSGISSERQLTSILGKLSRVQTAYDNELANKAGKAAGWIASKLPYGDAVVKTVKTLAGVPAKQQVISYGVAAVNKRMDTLGEP